MIYGYCRISTRQQKIERQERNILARYPDAHIVKEVFTGTKFQGRKELEKIIKTVKEGDTIVFDSVSRMSRNAEEGWQLYEELFNRNIDLVFLKEPHINTATYRQALESQINLELNTGNQAADELMNSIIEALNNYTMALAREQIVIAFNQSEKEVTDLHQRTKEGMLTAKLNGKQIGQPKGCKYNIKKKDEALSLILKHSRDFNGGLTDEECMRVVGISHNTFYKYKNELKEKRPTV